MLIAKIVLDLEGESEQLGGVGCVQQGGVSQQRLQR